LNLEIFNAKQTSLTDADVRSIVEIECHPKVRKWLTEYIGDNIEKEFRDYRRFFRHLPKNTRVNVLIAKMDGKIVGFLALRRLGISMEHVGSIGISVHPDHWGKGIAIHLIESAIELAKEKGLKRLEIETLAENTAMRHAAEKLGFILEGIRKNRIHKDGTYHDEAAYFLLI